MAELTGGDATVAEFPAPKKRGRPAFGPTDEQRRMVEAMTGYGIPQEDIARVVGIDPETLRTHFRDELDTGSARANCRVAEFLFQRATGQRGDDSAAVTAAIFWMKTRARWKETIATEHSGPDGKPITIEDRAAELERKRAAAREILTTAFGDNAATEVK